MHLLKLILIQAILVFSFAAQAEDGNPKEKISDSVSPSPITAGYAVDTKKKRKSYFELATQPLSILEGSLVGNLMIGIGQMVTTGLEANYIRFSEHNFKIDGFNASWITDFYLSSIFEDSVFLQLGFGYKQEMVRLNFAVEDSAIDGIKSGRWQSRYANGLLGYRWVWDSGFHIALAGGYQKGSVFGSTPRYQDLDGNIVDSKNRMRTSKALAIARVGYGF